MWKTRFSCGDEISSVETNDVVVLVFDPDAPFEEAIAGVFFRRNVEHHAANVAQKLAVHVAEVVVGAVEILRGRQNIIQEKPMGWY